MLVTSEELPAVAEKVKSQSLKFPVDVLESAKIVAALKGQTMTELLADILRPALAKLEEQELAKRAKAKKANKDQ